MAQHISFFLNSYANCQNIWLILNDEPRRNFGLKYGLFSVRRVLGLGQNSVILKG